MSKLQISRSDHKIDAQIMSFFLLFLIIFTPLHISLPLTTISAETNLLITTENIDVTLYSGDIKATTFNIENIGTSDLYWNLTYSSNLGLDDDTVGLWYFNEGSGSETTDETTHQNNGVVSGARWTDGIFGTALKFDGKDDYVLVQNTPNLNVESLTMETWIKFDSLSDTVPIGGVKDMSYGLYYREKEVITPHVWAQGLKWYDTNVILSTEKWYYFAMTFDASTGKLAWYLNGVKMDSRNEGANSMDTTTSHLIFGRGWTENMFDLFDGVIDEIRISNTARSAEEILNNYQRGMFGRNEWLNITKKSGKIEPGGIDTVDLVLNASTLTPGLYTREITMLINDPDSTHLKIPVNIEVLPVGNDVAISSLDAVDSGEVGDRVFIDAFVSNLGENHQNEIIVSLKIDGEIEDTILIGNLPPHNTTKVSFNWIPPVSGFFNVEVGVSPVQGEVLISNNVLTLRILIHGLPKISISPQVLNIEGDPGDLLEDTIIIHNSGFGNLTYLLTDSFSKYVFIDDLENVGGWTHTGEHDSWEFGEPKVGPDSSYSGNNCWGTDLDGNYRDFSDCSLISPVIDLSNRVQPELLFSHWFSIDQFSDHGFVEVWDGVVWNTLNPEGITGYSGGWIQSAFSLVDYTGKDVIIRFRLHSDEQVLDKGWFIDDVYVIDDEWIDRDWLIESPDIGRISPKESNEITVTVQTQGFIPGLYFDSIIIRTNDPDNGTLEIPVEVVLKGDDIYPPFAHAGSDITIEEDIEIQFDGSKSRDNFEISEYEWVFTDKTTITLNGVQPKYIFETPGTYEVILSVVDSSGNRDSDNLVVSIIDITKPNAKAGKDVTAHVRNAINFDGSDSIDNTEIILYEWDLGDGTKKEGEKTTHIYNKAGTYNITLTVTDSEGNIDTDYILVEILPPEGSGFYVLLLFIAFILTIIIVYQRFLIQDKTKKTPTRDIYRLG